MSTALGAAYRTHGPAVYRRARRILGNDADAVEVVQEVFASLVDRPDRFEGRSSLMTFLYAATTHRCLNLLRDSQNRRRLLERRGAGPSLAPAAAEQQVIVKELLRGLPDPEAQVLVYYYVDEMSQAEIAELLGCSRRHVGNLLARVRQRCGEGPKDHA